ncbi:MAG: porin family protein [Longimicrobiales bacterium]
MSLKVRLATAATALLIGSAAHAQMPSLNIMVGPTYASRETNGPAFESDPIFTIGGGGGFRFGNRTFGFEPGVLIVSKGTSQTDGDVDNRLKLDYIELPVLGIITIGSKSMLHPFIGGGPVVSLEMRCRVESIRGNSKEEIGCDLPNSATFDRHKVDLGVAGLAGVEYAISSSKRIALQARYTHGLSNISDTEDSALLIHNRAWSFYVSYSLPLKPDF